MHRLLKKFMSFSLSMRKGKLRVSYSTVHSVSFAEHGKSALGGFAFTI